MTGKKKSDFGTKRTAHGAAPIEANTAPVVGERIAKRLARAGVASRRDAEAMIVSGRISVNGKVLTSPALNVSDADRIEVDGAPMPVIERTRLFLFHKPAGVVTTNRDPQGRKTVFDVLPKELPRLLAVGRLDIATEGLLLLTNDGGLSRVLELPATGWLRRYRVRVHGTPDEAKLASLKDGIAIDGVFYGSIEASIDRIQGSNAWLSVGLREGKNREVRNIMEALGLTVNRLIRVSYGPFQLADLGVGEVREIRGRTLRDQLGERLIEEAGANFDAPIATPVPAVKPADKITLKDKSDRAGKPRRVFERGDKPSDKRDKALGRLQTKAPPFEKGGKDDKRGKPEQGRNRASHVWMAPGARPKGPKKTAETEERRYAGSGATKPKRTDNREKGAAKGAKQTSGKQQARSQNWKAKGGADRRR